MAYTKFHVDWKNRPNFSTPITAEAMEHIEEGIAEAHRLLAAIGSGGGVSLVEDPPGSGLFVTSSGTSLTENPPGSGLFETGV